MNKTVITARPPMKIVPKNTANRKRRKRGVSLEKKKSRSGWMFIMPFVIGFAVIYLPLVIESIRYAFGSIRAVKGGISVDFVGFENFKTALFVDTGYVKVLISGLKQLAFDVPAIVIFSLFMAVLLNQKMFGRAAFRAIFFVPVILCTGLIGDIDRSTGSFMDYMTDTSGSIDTGAGSDTVTQIVSMTDLSFLFSGMQVGTELLQYVTGIINNIYNIVNRSGVQMLIFLAGLQSISPAIYESCSIDGASAWETFWKITLPMISPMILVNAIYTVIDSFTSSSNEVMVYIKEVYGKSGGQVLSSAMSWMYFLIVLGIIGLVAALLSAFVFYQKRD